MKEMYRIFTASVEPCRWYSETNLPAEYQAQLKYELFDNSLFQDEEECILAVKEYLSDMYWEEDIEFSESDKGDIIQGGGQYTLEFKDKEGTELSTYYFEKVNTLTLREFTLAGIYATICQNGYFHYWNFDKENMLNLSPEFIEEFVVDILEEFNLENYFNWNIEYGEFTLLPIINLHEEEDEDIHDRLEKIVNDIPNAREYWLYTRRNYNNFTVIN